MERPPPNVVFKGFYQVLNIVYVNSKLRVVEKSRTFDDNFNLSAVMTTMDVVAIGLSG